MSIKKNNLHKIIIWGGALAVLIMGVVLFFIPPALFPDPSMGFQVLRCMNLGGSFNIFTSPDQSDISQNYSEFLTWWSPGQYVVPWVVTLVTRVNLGQAMAITVAIAQLLGLAGFYLFFKKIGFTSLVSAISVLFIVCQQAFAVPYVFYNGGEVLLFAFEGWFLYGCTAFEKPGLKMVLFVLFCGWLGFFLKSSFIWIYAAGLCYLWIRLCSPYSGIGEWIKRGVWLAVPAALSLGCIYIFFLSKGQTPASASNGIKLTFQTFGFPIASPFLSAFSIDDMLHGLFFHTGKPMLDSGWSLALLVVLALLTLLLIVSIIRFIPNRNYRLLIIIFYAVSILFFGAAFLRQLSISYEARHFRLIGLLVMPGIIYLLSTLKLPYQIVFASLTLVIASVSFNYLIKGYKVNNNINAKGVTGVAQPNIDQQSLDRIIKLDKKNKNAVFVFVSIDLGLEIKNNRIITLPDIGDDLKIDVDDYRYEGHAGPLYIILPETYSGPKEKMIMKSFPGYKGFNVSMLSDKYVLYAAK